MARDDRDDHSQSAKYVSPDVIGSSDLDDYGTWKENSEYGNVWVPNDQGDDWQPYSNGNWMYQQPYGWTWVGYEPWGFAPYHYGRWVQGGWGWGWAPGPYAYWGSPYYAPALVAWFGGPRIRHRLGWRLGFGFGGGWGWCALGWGEPFHPWYHGGRGYFRNVNIRNTRITNITNITTTITTTMAYQRSLRELKPRSGGDQWPHHHQRHDGAQQPGIAERHRSATQMAAALRDDGTQRQRASSNGPKPRGSTGSQPSCSSAAGARNFAADGFASVSSGAAEWRNANMSAARGGDEQRRQPRGGEQQQWSFRERQPLRRQ